MKASSTADGNCVPVTSNGERLSAILKKLFEPNVSGDATEEFVKAAANGYAVIFTNAVSHHLFSTLSIYRPVVRNISQEHRPQLLPAL